MGHLINQCLWRTKNIFSSPQVLNTLSPASTDALPLTRILKNLPYHGVNHITNAAVINTLALEYTSKIIPEYFDRLLDNDTALTELSEDILYKTQDLLLICFSVLLRGPPDPPEFWNGVD